MRWNGLPGFYNDLDHVVPGEQPWGALFFVIQECCDGARAEGMHALSAPA
jgi:hypothetical protein